MVDDVEALSLVQECRELEDRYKSDFTSQVLNAGGLDIIREAQDHIIKKDQALYWTPVIQ